MFNEDKAWISLLLAIKTLAKNDNLNLSLLCRDQKCKSKPALEIYNILGLKEFLRVFDREQIFLSCIHISYTYSYVAVL